MSAKDIERKLRKLVDAVRHRRLRAALTDGLAAGTEHRHLARLDVRHVVDVGANRGQFSLCMLDAFDDVRIDAFEPFPDTADVFAKHVEGSRVTLHRMALADDESTSVLHVSKLDDNSSLLPIGETQQELFPGTEAKTTIEVPVRRLDDVLNSDDLERPLLLKIDVQGSELNVIRGAERTLKVVDYVYVECSFVELYSGQPLAPAVIEELRGAGFQLTGVYDVLYRADICIQADFLFERT